MSAGNSSARLWKPADDDQSREMAASGKSPSEIGRLLHRSPSAVRKARLASRNNGSAGSGKGEMRPLVANPAREEDELLVFSGTRDLEAS
jgi:hypothetical protein